MTVCLLVELFVIDKNDMKFKHNHVINNIHNIKENFNCHFRLQIDNIKKIQKLITFTIKNSVSPIYVSIKSHTHSNDNKNLINDTR